MEKLLLKFLLSGAININDVPLEYAENEQFFKILKRLHSYNKKNKSLMLESDLLLMLQTELSSTEYRKVEAYIEASKNFPSDLQPEDVLQEAKVSSILKRAQGTLEEIADAGLEKNKDKLLVKSKELYELAQASKEARSVSMGDDIKDDLFFLDSFSPSLNEMTAGLAGLVVVGAVSGGGKSMYSIQEAYHQWQLGNSSVIFSLEMQSGLVEARILSLASGVPFLDIIKSKLKGDKKVPLDPLQQTSVDAAKKAFRESPNKIFILDNVFDMDEITANIVSFSTIHDIRLVIIDYMNLATSKSSGENWAKLTSWAKELNQLAIERSLVIISPSQIDVTENPDGTLGIRTRGSSELQNSATLALLLHRNEETRAAGLIQLNIAKSRNGTKAAIALEDKLSVAKMVDVGIIEKY